ncbi:MAG: TM2 domain-containing protein [Candidatus Cloacimonetes bacterium]|nr:TM2 domain-containing protein [Candidatus Cloacimonadota bacterium]
MIRRKSIKKYVPGKKDTLIAYILLFPPMGMLGLHKFYLGQPIWGLLYFFTGAFSGLGIIYDLLKIPEQVEQANALLNYRDAPQRGELYDSVYTATGGETPHDENIIEADYEYIHKNGSGFSKPERSLEARIIELAEASELNQLTLKDLIKAGIPLDDAKRTLEKLAREGVCEEVNMDATKVYCF